MSTEHQEEAPPEQQPQQPETVQLKDQLLRLQADFENARRRWRKDQAEIQERANADLLRELLEIHDDFQRALAAGRAVPPEALEAGTELLVGVEMISRRLQDFLKSYGIEPMEAVGKPFDPLLHEAVAHEETDSAPEATVLEELRKGYSMNGRVLRPAVVKVAKCKEDKING